MEIIIWSCSFGLQFVFQEQFHVVYLVSCSLSSLILALLQIILWLYNYKSLRLSSKMKMGRLSSPLTLKCQVMSHHSGNHLTGQTRERFLFWCVGSNLRFCTEGLHKWNDKSFWSKAPTGSETLMLNVGQLWCT